MTTTSFTFRFFAPMMSNRPSTPRSIEVGGKIFQAKAFNPRTDAVYSAVSMACSNFAIVPLETSRSGVNWDRMGDGSVTH